MFKKKKIKKGDKIEKIIEKLLQNRGIKSARQREEFFNPTNPSKISAKEFGVNQKQLDKALKRIQQAIKNKEKVIVYGDYDVDGICAAAILWETLDFLGARAMPHIPSRFTEGYGLNEESVKELAKDKEVKLIITVDQGIVAHDQVKTAKELGVDVIITDHHQPGDKAPDAYAVIHSTQISGSTVAWILARELAKISNFKFQISNLDDHLGLVALGTITDVLPLVGINRSLVVHGLKVLRTSVRVGIKALCKEAAVSPENLDTYHIGFILGPRLNAMGRVDHAMESLRLLCVRDRERARLLAEKLGKSNRLRQEKTEAVVSHVNTHYDPVWADGNIPKLLYVSHTSYEEGVIGIAAGRLVDKYHRPAIVLSIGEEYSKASARSVSGVNIIELLKKAGDGFASDRPSRDGLFKSVGGHPMAAGFTVKTSDIELLGQRLREISELEIDEEVLIRSVRVDMEIKLSEVTNALLGQIAKFAPFGFGNPEPTFETSGVNVLDMRLLGKEKNHLKMLIEKDGITFSAIGFRMGEFYQKLSPAQPANIIYAIEENVWNGNKSLQLKLKNISA